VSQDIEKNKSQNNNLTLYVIIGVLVMGILAVLLYMLFDNLTAADDQANSSGIAIVDQGEFDGSTRLEPPRDVEDFTLTSHRGEPISLSDLRGNLVLMTFGYTHCPDICPITINEFKNIQQELEDDADEVRFVFVSVDGQRDTPQTIADFFRVRRIDEGFIGLTGEDDVLQRMKVDYGVDYKLNEPREDGYYLVDHTAGSFLLDREGRWVVRYTYGTEPDVIIEDIREMLRQT
jgi:protein SCO1/2